MIFPNGCNVKVCMNCGGDVKKNNKFCSHRCYGEWLSGKSYGVLFDEKSAKDKRKKMSLSGKGKVHKFRDKNGFKKLRSLCQLKLWDNKDYAKKQIKLILSKVSKRPNLLEKKYGLDLESRFPGKFKYCGNGSVMINGHFSRLYF